MSTLAYCWRCKTKVPMLDEQEWEQIYPHLNEGVRQIKEHRQRHDSSLYDAKNHVYGDGLVQRYYELTGYQAKDPATIRHHRLSQYGPPCRVCRKLLRTPQAKLCAECGAAA